MLVRIKTIIVDLDKWVVLHNYFAIYLHHTTSAMKTGHLLRTVVNCIIHIMQIKTFNCLFHTNIIYALVSMTYIIVLYCILSTPNYLQIWRHGASNDVMIKSVSGSVWYPSSYYKCEGNMPSPAVLFVWASIQLFNSNWDNYIYKITSLINIH